MREIKFRAWHKEQEKMYSAEELGADQMTLMPDGRGFANISGDNVSLSQIDNGRKMIPLQYTGLKDKNGKGIYEGDIVNFSPYGVSVVWYCVNHYRFECEDFDLAEVEEQEDIEVIGNIYENPELIKEKIDANYQSKGN